MAGEWAAATVAELQRKGVLLVEDGNHGEYRPRPDEFVDRGVAFIRAADMDGAGSSSSLPPRSTRKRANESRKELELLVTCCFLTRGLSAK
jgi:hypothetical protein